MPRTPETVAPLPVEPLVTGSGGLVVATDGTRDSDGAVRVGLALARRDGVKADVFSVVEAPSIVDLDGVPVSDLEQLVEIAVDERGAMLLTQRDRTHPGTHEWPYELAVGSRVDTIVDRARATGASFILLGLGAHSLGARLSQRETALRVIRAAELPVLALPCGASLDGLPIGAQIVGRPFDEATVLRAGHAYEQATDWHRRRPTPP